MLRWLDDFLNNLTMYRLMYWGLWVVAGWALMMSLWRQLAFSPLSLAVSAGVLWLVCKGANFAFAKLFSAMPNRESAAITALILFVIMAPPRRPADVVPLVLAGVLAMASKYFLAWRAKHIFNPAAIALVILGLLGSGKAIWWVASPVMLPIVLILGLLVARKLRRLRMVAVFVAAAAAMIVVVAMARGLFTPGLATDIFISWPLVFFGTIMLIEPSTAPADQRKGLVYAVVVAVIFGAQTRLGPVASTPQVALVVGNLLVFATGFRGRLRLRLTSKRRLADGAEEFVFAPGRPPVFAAGQYLEWTLPHAHSDSRGVRRYFTIASSPTESDVRLGVRIAPERSSSFKAALRALPAGGVVDAWQPAGDFVLPRDPTEKLVFMAGGIGITPFRSMVKYLLDTNQRRDIVLLYSAATAKSFAYREVFDEAERKLGLQARYLLPDAPVTPDVLRELAPDFAERTYYLAGPPAMVRAYRQMLRSAGVPGRQVKTDFFSGY